MRSGANRPVAIVLALVVIVMAAACALTRFGRPSIDPSAATNPITRTVLTGPVSPDVTEGPIPTGDVDPGDMTPATPQGNECLDRIVRGDGWLDLCWAAGRYGNEADPTKDYYLLRVYGSYEGVRWLVVGSRLLVDPGDGAFDAWPDGTFEGACRQEQVHLLIPLTALATEYVCGHTEGRIGIDDWSHRVTWRCEACLLPDATTRGFGLYSVVGVPEGTVPSWDVFGDAGG